MWRDDAFLHDVIEAADRIRDGLRAIEAPEFARSPVLQDAVPYRLLVIGEALNRVSPEIKEKYSDLPWSQIVGLRHRLAHDYGGIDRDLIWRIATAHVPPLRDRVAEIIEAEFPDDSASPP